MRTNLRIPVTSAAATPPQALPVETLWRSPLVTLELERHPAGTAFSRRDAARASFTLLLRGHYREAFPDQVIDYRAFMVVFHPAHLGCRATVGPTGADVLRFDIGEGLLGPTSRVRQSLRQVRDLSGSQLAWALLSVYADLAHAAVCPLVVEEPAAEVIGALARGRRGTVMREPRWMDRVNELIQYEFHRPLTLLRLAGVAGVSPVHLTQAYRRVYGHSMRDRAQRLRVMAACRLLRTTDRPVADVAAQTGFANETHLAVECRRLAGRLPAETQLAIRASTPSARLAPRLPAHPDARS